METDIGRRRQWPKCVGWVICAAQPVSRSFRISVSWDGDVTVRPRHRLGQRHRRQAGAPETGAVAATAQFGEAAAQHERERRAACMRPIPPTPRRMAGNAGAARRVAQRGAGQQVQQNALLFGPRVPAARCDAQRQARTGATASAAAEAGNLHGIERGASRSATIGFALVAAVQPGLGNAAMGTGVQPVDFRRVHDLLDMLGQGRKCG